ncbi:hep_Hag family protein [Collimonas fungivorans]|uniref:Hep_Hag family protein n=2 Tax=Collimonas fungivorans TaxID=158899 RepID=A0A127P634_9BURK|nr:hep_Hag family protein [Collimonas fungivorans]
MFAALVASGWLGWASLAQAQAVDCSVAPYNTYNGTASCMGFQSAASGIGATALGSLAHANVLGALAVGYNALSTGQNGIALGFQAYTNAINTVYIGARTSPTAGATSGGAIGIGTDVTASGPNALAIGTLAIGASTNSVAFANSSSVDANSVNSIAIGYVTKVVNSNNAIALGSGSLVSGGTHGTAVGWQAYASALNAVYLGARTAGTGASAESAIGIGTDVSASGIYSIGMGLGANASAANAIAIGRASKAQAASTIAFGDSSTVAAAAGAGSIAAGHNSQVTGGTGAVALGEGQVANGNGAVAIGDPNSANGTGAVTVGANNTSNGQGAISLGNSNSATGQGSIALGNASTAAAAGGIALGDTANAALGNGVAIGANSNANNANDVALGAGSTTAAPHTGVTAQFGGTAAGIANAASGVVSVGAAGAERQIQNVAAGVISSSSTDAINGSQLNTVVTGVNNLGATTAGTLGGGAAYDPATGNVTGFNQPINSVSATGAVTGPTAQTTVAGALTALNTNVDNTANIAVKYDAVGGSKITLGATGGAGAGAPVTITNLAPAALNSTSTDAVNGSQLYGTNQNVTNLTDGKIGPFVSDNSVTAVQPVSSGANASAGGFGATATGAASTVVGNQASDNGNANATVLGQGASIAAGTAGSNVALGQGSTVATAAVPTTGATIGGTAYTFAGGAPAGVVSVGSAGNERQITNVAAGQLSGTSTDAVNGSQLFATNQQVTANTTAITNINNGGGIKYFHASSTLADSTATGTDSVAVGPTANATATDAMALGHGATAANAGAVALGAGSTTAAAVATTGATINGTTYAFAGAAPTSTVSVGSVGNERTITNVAAGQLSTGSTDAVNGSQLNATNLAIAASKTHYYSVNDGGTQGGNYDNNGATGQDALAAGVGSSASAANDVAIGNAAAASGGSSIAIGDGAQASGANSISIGSGNVVSGASSVAIGDPTTITGAGSFSVGNNNSIASNNTFVFGSNVTVPAGLDGSVVLGSGSAAATANPTSSATVNGTTYGGFAGATPTSTVSVGAVGAERQITNVAAGQLTATSTDAINGSQLYSVASGLGTAISNLSTVVNANQFPIASSEGKAFSGSVGAAGSNSLGMGTNVVATGQNSTAAGQGSVANQANTTALGQGAQATAANSTALGQGAVAGTGNSVAIGSASATTAAVATAGTTIRGTSYSFAGAAPVGSMSVGSAGNERQIQNVAAGQLSATSTDAINGSQLYATNSAINNLTNVVASTQVKYYSDNSSGGGNVNNDGATGADAMAMGKNTTATATNAVAMGPGASATASNGVAIGAASTADRAGLSGAKESFSNTAVASTQGAVSVGSAGNERQITNVAGGTQATDAVNVRQLQAVQAGGVHYDTNTDGSTNYSSVTMGNGGSSPVAIHNVEAGTAATDAVNVSQLNTGLSSAVQQANQHADGLAMQLQNNINDVAKKAYAGVAAAMSMESAPYVAGKITYSAGYGYYQNQNAIGISLRRTADNGRWALSGGVSGTTSGGVAARLAVSGVLN